MELLSSPLFWIISLLVLIISYFIGKKIADKKFGNNPYLSDPKIKEVMENPSLLKEKLSNIQVKLSDGRDYKINKIVDYGKEVDLDHLVDYGKEIGLR